MILTAEIVFTVPLLPPSGNHYKQPRAGGGWFVTKEAQAYIAAVGLFAGKTFSWNYIDRTLNPPDRKLFYSIEIIAKVSKAKLLRCDVDNLLKVGLDALTRTRVIKDDRYISHICLDREQVQTAHEESMTYNIRGIEQ